MFDIVVILTPEEKPFKVFLREELFNDYKEISDKSILHTFNSIEAVNECYELLVKLVSAPDIVAGFKALNEIQKKIRLKEHESLVKSFIFLLDNRIEKRETYNLIGISGCQNSRYDAHSLSLDELIQFIEKHYFSIYSENVKRDIYVLLSEKGNSFRVFLDQGFTREYLVPSCPVEVSSRAELKKFSYLWVVKEHRNLLEQLIQSRYSDQETILKAFKDIQTAIVVDNLSFSKRLKQQYEGSDPDLSFLDNNNRLKTSFAFIHETTTLHPDHYKRSESFVFRTICGMSHFVAHQETLENAIKFIEEYCFFRYEGEQRKDFIRGFNYQNSSWSNPFTWIEDWFQGANEDFDNGRKAAIETAKYKR